MVDVFFRGYGVWLVWEDEEANYPISDRYPANGVFSLTEEDEVKYRHTESLKGIDTLCPSNHSDSEFKKALGRGMFDTELARLAEAAKFRLGSEWVDPEQFHSALEKDARFHFNADKEMPLVLAKEYKPNTEENKTQTETVSNLKSNDGMAIAIPNITTEIISDSKKGRRPKQIELLLSVIDELKYNKSSNSCWRKTESSQRMFEACNRILFGIRV